MTCQLSTVNKDIKELSADVIAWRRHLHAHPELSFHEEKTSQFVYDTLQSFGGIELDRPTATSVTGLIRGLHSGPTLAIRADMDALPIEEANDISYKSTQPGVMHACGHDGHTAMLLGAAKLLVKYKNHLYGSIKLIFQHAEELYPGGAEEMVDNGVMDGVDWIIGAHLWSPLESGKIGIVYGPMMASPDTFYITITGKGGHAALPHQTVDSIAVGAQVVSNLQHVVSRNTDPLDPLVVSVTQFIGGTTHNVIPGSVKMCGTVRSFNPELRDQVPDIMNRIIKGITDAHGASYNFKYEKGYRPLINHNVVTRIIEDVVVETYGKDALDFDQKNMAGEDFSAYLQKTPGTFFYVGVRNDEKMSVYPHHHAQFNIDEAALEKGVTLFIHTALKYLCE